MEYILFIHRNWHSSATEAQWQSFLSEARNSGMFLGGSEIAPCVQIGDEAVDGVVDKVAGFMRFETANRDDLLVLLQSHPIALCGGTLELCEMPKSA